MPLTVLAASLTSSLASSPWPPPPAPRYAHSHLTAVATFAAAGELPIPTPTSDCVLHPGRGSPEDLGDLPSYAAARPTCRCPLKRMFMTYTLQSLARYAHLFEVGNAIDRDEASRAADKVAFEMTNAPGAQRGGPEPGRRLPSSVSSPSSVTRASTAEVCGAWHTC